MKNTDLDGVISALAGSTAASPRASPAVAASQRRANGRSATA